MFQTFAGQEVKSESQIIFVRRFVF